MNLNDYVILKSGGPPMLIVLVVGNNVACYWHDVYGNPYTHVFNTACVLPINTMKEYMLCALDDKVF